MKTNSCGRESRPVSALQWIRVFRGAVALFVAGAFPSQVPVVVPSGDLQTQRVAVVQAFLRWNNLDTSLDELARMSEGDVSRRITKAEEAVSGLIAAKSAYYDALQRQLSIRIERLERLRGPGVLAEHSVSERAESEREIARLRLEEDALSGSLQSVDSTDVRSREFRSAIEKELEQVQRLRHMLQEEMRIYRAGELSSDPFEESASRLAAKYRQLKSILTIEMSRLQSERTLWHEYYRGLRKAVTEHARKDHSKR